MEHADRQRFKLLYILRETRRDMIEGDMKRNTANKSLSRSIRGPLNPGSTYINAFLGRSASSACKIDDSYEYIPIKQN